MPKKLLLLFILLATSYLLPTTIQARTTPEDIYQSQKKAYESKLQTYSPTSQQKLENFSQNIANLNKKITTDWEANCLRQGEILDEYVRRNNISENGGPDGIHRNLSNEVVNARYWLTYAHEAVAYQAAHKYVFNLTSEKNINSDINSQINLLDSDLTTLRAKVLKSQQLIAALISKP